MDSIILDTINLELDEEQFTDTVRVGDEGPEAERARELFQEASTIGRPKAMYGVARVDGKGDGTVVLDGVTFTSRVFRVNMGEAHRAFPYIASCGSELAKWAETLSDVLERYWADVLMQMTLHVAIQAVNEEMDTRFRPGKTAVMNPGSLTDWPISQQKPLFTLFSDPYEAIGVRLRESFLMSPLKSVSGIRFPTESSFESCQLCPRLDCPGRRAPYDEALYQSGYGIYKK